MASVARFSVSGAVGGAEPEWRYPYKDTSREPGISSGPGLRFFQL